MTLLAPLTLCLYWHLLFQYSKSPLMIALENRHLDLVKTLIEAGANVNQIDKVCSV